MQNMPLGGMDMPGLRLRPVEMDAQVAKFDLTLSVSESPAGFVGTFEYNVDLFDEATMRRMAGHFERLLAAAVADQPGQGPDTPIGYLPLLTAAERAHLAAWNAATAVGVPLAALDHPIYACLRGLGRTHARRTRRRLRPRRGKPGCSQKPGF